MVETRRFQALGQLDSRTLYSPNLGDARVGVLEEPVPAAQPRVFIVHQVEGFDLSERRRQLPHLVVGQVPGQAADEELERRVAVLRAQRVSAVHGCDADA